MTRVTRRPLAADDIAEVWDYIAEDNLDAADRWIDRLDEQFGLLATQPLMGRARPEIGPELRSYRRCDVAAFCRRGTGRGYLRVIARSNALSL